VLGDDQPGASSSFCDADAQLLFELLVYHNVHIKSFFKRTAQDSGYFIDIEKIYKTTTWEVICRKKEKKEKKETILVTID
jgi:hypothetical protein